MSSFQDIHDHFGPFVPFERYETIDFTLLFQDTILSILPASLFLLISTYHLWKSWQTHRKIAFVVFLCLQLANTIVWAVRPSLRTRASQAAVSLSLVVASILYLLSGLEHARNVRPCSVINAYLLITLPFDAAKVRTLWLQSNDASLAGLSLILLLVKLLILVIEAVEKRSILTEGYEELPPEQTSGLYSRSLFWWLNPIFWLGSRRVIRIGDLYSVTDELSSQILNDRFQHAWKTYGQQVPSHTSIPADEHVECRQRKPGAIIMSLINCTRKALLAAIFPRLSLILFRFMQPLLIRRVTRFVEQATTPLSTDEGWGLVAAYGLVSIGIAISTAVYYHKAYRMITMVRGALVSAIYKQTMDLPITTLDRDSAITLMSTDVQQICDALVELHELWASLIEIGLAIWLLYGEIGLAMLGPLLLTLVSVLAALLISSRMADAQKHWLFGIQARVGVITKFLQSIKEVKQLGFINKMLSVIKDLRQKEIALSINARRLLGLGVVLGNTPDMFSPGIAFTIFVIVAKFNGQTLDVTAAFTALSLITLLTNPISMLIFSIPPLMGAIGCLGRIQTVLSTEGRKDARTLGYSHTGSARLPSGRHTTPEKGGLTHPAVSEIIALEKRDFEQDRAAIRVEGLTLGWKANQKAVINDSTLTIPWGSVVMFVGPVGCGKSTFFKGLLGELGPRRGTVYLGTSELAFVDQKAWVPKGTIQEIIVGKLPYVETWYTSVVHSCALDQDIKSLPLGSSTMIGSADNLLSGGQVMRLALAQATYTKRPILILDDVFSGLDSISEDQVFARLFGPEGIHKRLGTTVLLATHATKRLSCADMVYEINDSGVIVQSVTLTQFTDTNPEDTEPSTEARTTTNSDQDQTRVKAVADNHARDLHEAQDLDDSSRAVGDLSIYNFYFKAIGWTYTAIFLALMFTDAFFSRFPELWIKFWVSAIAKHGNAVNGKYLALFLVFEFLGWFSLVLVVLHAFLNMVPKSAIGLHDRLLDTVTGAPLSFSTSTDIGQIVNRFSQDMDVIDLELPLALIQFTASTCIATMQTVLICLSAAYFGAVIPLVLALMYILQKFYLRTSRQIRLMDLEAKTPLYSNFIESINGLATIRAYGDTVSREKQNISLLDVSQSAFYLLYCIQRWLTLVMDLMVAGLAVILMVLVVLLRDRLDAGLVGLGLLNLMSLNITLTQVIKFWTSFETSLGAIARIKSFIEQTPSEHHENENHAVLPSWPEHGAIELSGVSASYSRETEIILRNITISIPPGSKLGLCGRSGSGKSSFCSLLLHLMELRSGTLSIDGIDICMIPREVLRSRLTVIPQRPFFLKASVRENLVPYGHPDIDDMARELALREVELWGRVQEAGGLDAEIDLGNLFSYGQQQLFCLARAALQSNKIIVMDEATANVDPETDLTMQRIIRQKFSHCTIIAIAHRLHTIRDFDCIAVMDRGQIVEHGKPKDLLDNEHSRFRQLWVSTATDS